MFSLASDPALANVVINNGQPLQTWATNHSPAFTPLPSGTFFWNVVPVDSEGNKGTPSPVTSFTWSWPSTTTPRVTDLMDAPEMFDPQFSWDPVAGATKHGGGVDQVRGRVQLLGRLRARLEGLLHSADDVHVARADRRLPRQHVLLAR